MKKPELGKRLLPLLDIILILLAFFIILPNGIVTKEKLELGSLREKNQDLQHRLSYLRWKYGDKTEIAPFYNRLTVLVAGKELEIGNRTIPPNQWPKVLAKEVRDKKIDLVMIQIVRQGEKKTRYGAIKQLAKILDSLNVIHIFELQ